MEKAGFILRHICLCFMEKQIWLITSFPWSQKLKCTLKVGAVKSKTNVDLNGDLNGWSQWLISIHPFSWVNRAGSRNSHPGSEQHHSSFNVIPNYRTTFFAQLRPRAENSWVSSLFWSWAAGPSWCVVALHPHLSCHGMVWKAAVAEQRPLGASLTGTHGQHGATH